MSSKRRRGFAGVLGLAMTSESLKFERSVGSRVMRLKKMFRP